MIFYDFDLFAPSPWIVWIFAQEKGIKLERKIVDLLSRENRREPFTSKISPFGELPAIELDDGTAITEINAICEYLEEVYPEPPLIGTTPVERAQTRMWVRRIEQKIAEPMGEGFSAQEGREFFEKDATLDGVLTKKVLPLEAAAVLKQRAKDKMIWLDRLFRDGGWVCGDRFTFADIYLYCYLQFGENHGQPIPDEAPALRKFFERMKARPTAWEGEPGRLD